MEQGGGGRGVERDKGNLRCAAEGGLRLLLAPWLLGCHSNEGLRFHLILKCCWPERVSGAAAVGGE
jgi:hypothetical protein